MLRITVDLVPHGDEVRAHPIGEMIIANDGQGNNEFGDYVFVTYDEKRGTDFGTLKNFYRDNGIWELISQCIDRGTWEENDLTSPLIDKILLRNDKI